VVASCVEILSIVAVGAVGVPVNDGDAIVARNNISAVLFVTLASNAFSALVALVISAVILEVFAVTLVFNEVISFVLTVMLDVFEAIAAELLVILAVLEVILESNAASAFVALVTSSVIFLVFVVMLAVLEAISVGNAAMVDELTPPTLFTVVENVPNPPPVTLPVNSTY
jgi:hypothetical protein